MIVRSFARIHETNLKKQGILPLTFANAEDYDRISGSDRVSLVNLQLLAPGQEVTMKVSKPSGESFDVPLQHTMNKAQIEWFKAGSALNLVVKSSKQ